MPRREDRAGLLGRAEQTLLLERGESRDLLLERDITGLAPTAVHIAWEASRSSERITAFVAAAQAVAAPR